MISKNLMVLFMVLGTSFCTHSEERISHWSELDQVSNMECVPLMIFDKAESINTKDLDVVGTSNGWQIKVTHTDRKGQIETRIGKITDPSELPQWTMKVFSSSLAYYSENDYLFVEDNKLYQQLNGQKNLIFDNPGESPLKVYEVGDSNIAVLFEDNLEIMSRQTQGSKFESLKKFGGVKNFSKSGAGFKWRYQQNDSKLGAGLDSKGLWSLELKDPKSEVTKAGDAIISYHFSEGDDGTPANLILGSNRKSWEDGYLRVLELPRQFVLQRWVDSESVVELLDVDTFKISTLGVLPENFWIRGSLDESNSQFLVEGKGKWQICAIQR